MATPVKKWRCLDCGYEFETPWIPSSFVRCPRCGSNRVFRIDPYRGRGGRPDRWRRGLCWRYSGY